MRYLIYARVSPRGSDFDRETSISMQIEYCKQYITLKGGIVADIRSDEFFSGKDTNRPAFKSILDELDKGTAEWDCLIVYKLSRMSRSLKDGALIFEKLFQNGKGFVCATENYDFSSPAGRAMLGMMQVFNQFEREQTAENTRNKMISIASRGEWPVGKPPFGYKRGAKKDNKLYIDEKKAQIVRNIFDMYISSEYTITDILRKYKNLTSASSVWYMLRNRTYLGKIIYAGKEYQGKHDPIISEAVFNAAQNLHPKTSDDDGYQDRPKAQTYPYLLTGIFYCHCGARMTPKAAKSGQFNYYTCRNHDCRFSVPAPKVEEALLKYLQSIKISDESIQKAYAIIKKDEAAVHAQHQPEINQLNISLRIAEDEMENIISQIIKGNLTEAIQARLNARSEVLENEIEDLKNKIAIRMKAFESHDAADMEYIVQLLKNFQALKLEDFNTDPIQAKQVINAFIGEIVIKKDLECQIYPAKSSPNIQKWLRQLDSNQRPSG